MPTGVVYERRWPFLISVLTANGTLQGLVTVADTLGFFVKQKINLTATGKPNLSLEIKRVISQTQMFVGPPTGDIDARVDVSQYTIALSAQITAAEQDRPNIRYDFVLRHVYQEEPAVALRVIQVDPYGNPIGSSGGGGVAEDVNVVKWGGAATSLGQKDMAHSVPVTLASDQSPLNVLIGQVAAVPQSNAILAAAITGTTPGTANTVITASADRTLVFIKNTLSRRVNLTIGADKWVVLDSNEGGVIDLGSNLRKIPSGQTIKVFRDSTAPEKGSLFISLV